MRNIVLNEAAYAESLLNMPPDSKNALSRLWIISKYYHSLGYKNKEVYDLLDQYVSHNNVVIPPYEKDLMLTKCVKDTEDAKLLEIDSIPVTQAEIDICKKQKGIIRQRLLFTLIVLAKYSMAVNANSNGWVSVDDSDIFMIANIKQNNEIRQLYLNDLMTSGTIDFSKKVDKTNIHVICVDKTGEAVRQISEIRDLGYQYSMIVNGEYKQCSLCGRYFKIVLPNSAKMCPACRKKNYKRGNSPSVLLMT